MLAEFIEKIVSLSSDNEVEKIAGQMWSTKQLSLVKQAMPDSLGVSTLSSVVSFLLDVDNQPDDVFIHVLSPTRVSVYTNDLDDNGRRPLFVVADVGGVKAMHDFGESMDQQQMLVYLQTCFEVDKNRDTLMSLIGSIKVENSSDVEDDGISQKISATQGIHLKKTVEVRNPFTLSPFCTFPEIKSPERQFILRVAARGGSEALLTLHETQSMLWRLEVMNSIGDHLRKKLPEFKIV